MCSTASVYLFCTSGSLYSVQERNPIRGKQLTILLSKHVVGDEEGQLSVKKGGYQCQLAQAKENLPTTSDKVNILRILSCYLQMKPSLDSPVR